MTGWTTAHMPTQRGRLAVITGATGGLGYEAALALAAAGAEVVLTGRNEDKGADALARLHAAHPRAAVRFAHLDVASLASVAAFADSMRAADRGVDLLINNAGIMAPPARHVTEDGFELQFATNHLGHFALTARLLPLLRRGVGARVVNVSSLAAHGGAIDLTDLQSERSYAAFRVYAMTKLAVLMSAMEFQRRSEAAGWNVKAMAAHPGIAQTSLIANGPASCGVLAVLWRLTSLFPTPFNASAAHGALPILFAATSPDANGGRLYGPSQTYETKGPPATSRPPAQALDAAMAASLWEASERLAGVRFA
ncbi:short chain dehydrogenase [Rhodoblastus sphagnicola]|uniref:Short chain dehydrogenase n=1 Tax=Rhodoblastus sphagnicola TaxID=333368 RepID=A0A2S6NH56_9HYPH|nr:SDR family oxidoreductase [Rhodoblastus sphagnicola]MBB4200310.1 NAD(P)-dependent dehydrogenase (short-subunit alcohol dehydrogenase family) [Rhodoblastus sphagnicola]PPQ33924.1 short chain dehydrogenase [Rhodoblastus sphagnicola]